MKNKLDTNHILLLSKSKSTHYLEKEDLTATLPKREPSVAEDLRNDQEEEKKINRKSEELARRQKQFNLSEATVLVEYAPRLFSHLRSLDNITSEMLEKSFDPLQNEEAVFKAGESQGKSGSFFFFTNDKNFLIKTMTGGEFDVFMKFLPNYYSYCVRHMNSLIARIYGVFQLTLPGLVPLYFFLMENCLKVDKTEAKTIKTYDLKGSKINREVFNEESREPEYPLKDINFLKFLKKEQSVLHYYTKV